MAVWRRTVSSSGTHVLGLVSCCHVSDIPRTNVAQEAYIRAYIILMLVFKPHINSSRAVLKRCQVRWCGWLLRTCGAVTYTVTYRAPPHKALRAQFTCWSGTTQPLRATSMSYWTCIRGEMRAIQTNKALLRNGSPCHVCRTCPTLVSAGFNETG